MLQARSAKSQYSLAWTLELGRELGGHYLQQLFLSTVIVAFNYIIFFFDIEYLIYIVNKDLPVGVFVAYINDNQCN